MGIQFGPELQDHPIDSIEDIVYVITPHEYSINWNETFETCLHPEDVADVDDQWEAAKNGAPYDIEHRVITDGGDVKWVHVRAELTFDDEGEPVAGIGIIQDITKQKVQERELEQYEAIFSNAGDALTIADDDARILDVNLEAARLYGESRQDLLGRSMEEFLPKDFDFESEWGAIQAAEMKRDELNIISADGGVNPVEYTAKTNIIPGQHLIASRSVRPDTAMTTQGGVASADTESFSDRNEQLEAFASQVSHDLRNPLTVASGHLEIAMADSESHHLNAIENAHTRMSRLIDDLLVLAKQGEAVSECETVVVTDLVTECWDNVDTVNGTLTVDVDRILEADRSRLKQVFENLFRNAMEHSEGEVSVQVGQVEDGISVTDTGPGISPENRERVFEAGFSTREDGTGFGLNITKEIVEAHGWSIRVTEGEEGGARFEITGMDGIED